MTQRDDQIYIGHMLDTANKAIGFVQGLVKEDFDNNELLRLSLTHLLQVIGEAARRVSSEFRTAYPQIDWKAIANVLSISHIFGLSSQQSQKTVWLVVCSATL